MSQHNTADPVRLSREQAVVTITFNRPELHNAFDDRLIGELHAALDEIAADRSIRAVQIRGAGPSFSAGADLNWMRRMAQASEAENQADAFALAQLLRRLNTLPQATIARVQGAALGGGMGIVSCCDVVIAAETAVFGLTEVHLGLIPAVISPYVVAKIGVGAARALAVTGRRFRAPEALNLGLVQHCVAEEQLDATVEKTLGLVLSAAPQAVAEAKQLIDTVRYFDGRDGEAEDQRTAAWIARLRVAAEGQEGLRAFLNKETPAWRLEPSTAAEPKEKHA